MTTRFTRAATTAALLCAALAAAPAASAHTNHAPHTANTAQNSGDDDADGIIGTASEIAIDDLADEVWEGVFGDTAMGTAGNSIFETADDALGHFGSGLLGG
ncbi:hypothetical protein ACFTWH_36290 [Streptomyces sp. NPDC057011]|uniref:hypothetical protein n=1 Tax=unclassified Streptomyces TaxID=2593676 RepID=UPI0036384A97